MVSSLKKKLGFIKRGFIGYLSNYLEKSPIIPDSIEKKTIGQTVNNARIEYYIIGNGEIKILFVSAIHGNETGTVKFAHHLIDWLDIHRELKEKFTFYVIPCLNVDGYHNALKNPDYFGGGNVGRFNANNVDLNRNFDTPNFKKESVWSSGKNYQEKKKVFCGEYGNSEPEIKSLTNFMKNSGIKVVYFFHNAGRDVMGNNNELSKILTQIYSDKTGFRLVSNDDWIKMGQTGTAKEWCEINGVAYVEIEGSSRWGSDWKIQKDAISATLNKISEKINL